MSVKTLTICDLCGKEYKSHKNWTLNCDKFFKEDYSSNRKIVFDICDECAEWIMSQRKVR